MNSTVLRQKIKLFKDECFFTDDTIITIAVAEGLINSGEKNDFIEL